VVSAINRMLHRMILTEDIPEWVPSFKDLTPEHWAYAAITEASIGHMFDRKHPGTESFLEIWTSEMQ
jgi:hypothetical protein